MATNAFDEIRARGLLFSSTEGTENLLKTEKVTLYNGFDITADSLHVGHMVPLLALARLQRFGHHPIALAGGGTTMVGDPSGKTAERALTSKEEIDARLVPIKAQLAHFLDFDIKTNPARVINNADWLLKLNLIDFLRDIGKHFTVNAMINKDSVKNRLDREEGLSFTEFSYQLIQSYDFLHLYQTAGCKLQTGGSDQWGNITGGVELIRRVTGGEAFGMTYPLITKADGSKFGKTASGSVWLDPQKTSPYRFYQFWLNTDDRNVIEYLNYFTFLPVEDVAALKVSLEQHPELREPHRKLAEEITRLLHGETALTSAVQASQALFGGSLEGLSSAEIADIFADVPSTTLPKDRLGSNFTAVDLLVESGFLKSKGEARRAIDEGGISVNNQRVEAPSAIIDSARLLHGEYLVLRRGRKNYHLVRVI